MTDARHRYSALLFYTFACCLASSWAHAATITVNTKMDRGTDPSLCYLNAALISAELDSSFQGCAAGSGPDIIEFSVTGSITLTGNLQTIGEPLQINGPGRNELVIDGDDQYVIFDFTGDSDNSAVRSMTLFQGSHQFAGGCLDVSADDFVLEDVTIEACFTESRGGGAKFSSARGRMSRVYMVGNRSTSSSGAVFVGSSDFLVEDSSFVGNRSGSSGGVMFISSLSSITFRRCTMEGNQADGSGGAIRLLQSAQVTLEDCTITNNTANHDEDGASDFGGGISAAGGTLTISNTIVTGNHRLPDGLKPNIAGGGTINSLGHNLVGINNSVVSEFPAGTPNANMDMVGTLVTPLDLVFSNLHFDEGPTPTLTPVSNPASSDYLIDKGSCAGENQDQRGYSGSFGQRIVDSDPSNLDDGCDIGAVEVGAIAILFGDGFESGDTQAWN